MSETSNSQRTASSSSQPSRSGAGPRVDQIDIVVARIDHLRERLRVLSAGSESGVEGRLLAHYQHRLASDERLLSKLRSCR